MELFPYLFKNTHLFDSDPLSSTFGDLLQTYLNPSPATSDFFGHSVAFVGNNILIGAHGDDDIGVNEAGAAYLFDMNGNLLKNPNNPDTATFKNPNPQSGDSFGATVTSVGNNLALIGSVHDGDVGSNAGAAFLFDADPLSSTFGDLFQSPFYSPYPTANDEFGNYLVGVDGKFLTQSKTDNTGGKNGVAFLYEQQPIPEPSTFVLFGIGILSVLGLGWRRRKKLTHR